MLKFVLDWIWPLQTLRLRNPNKKWIISYQARNNELHPKLQAMMEAAIFRIENYFGVFSSELEVLVGSKIILKTTSEVKEDDFNAKLNGGNVVVTYHVSRPQLNMREAILWWSGTKATICVEKKRDMREMHMILANCLAKTRLRELGVNRSIDESVTEGVAAFCEADSGISLSVIAVMTLIRTGYFEKDSKMLMHIPQCWAQVYTGFYRDRLKLSDLVYLSEKQLPDPESSLEFVRTQIDLYKNVS